MTQDGDPSQKVGKDASVTKGAVDRFYYDDRIVRAFLAVTLLWGGVGIVVGIQVALQLAQPKFNLGLSFISPLRRFTTNQHRSVKRDAVAT